MESDRWPNQIKNNIKRTTTIIMKPQLKTYCKFKLRCNQFSICVNHLFYILFALIGINCINCFLLVRLGSLQKIQAKLQKKIRFISNVSFQLSSYKHKDQPTGRGDIKSAFKFVMTSSKIYRDFFMQNIGFEYCTSTIIRRIARRCTNWGNQYQKIDPLYSLYHLFCSTEDKLN